jgi:branched-chain amino acid transport system substrate-binding protein
MAGVEALGGNVSNRRALAAMLGRTPFTGARGELVLDPRTNNVVQDILVFETRKRPGGEGIDFEVLARMPSVRVDPDACQMG